MGHSLSGASLAHLNVSDDDDDGHICGVFGRPGAHFERGEACEIIGFLD